MSGLKALDHNEPQVKITINNNLKEVAMRLRDEKLLPRADYRTVTNPLSLLPADMKVDFVYDKLTGKVEEDDSHFLTFLNILRSHTHSEETVGILEKTYTEDGGVLPYQTAEKKEKKVSPSPAQPAQEIDSIPVPDEFSEDFSPQQFATWMKIRKYLSDDNCDIIVGKAVSGVAFVSLTEVDLKEFGFVGSGYFALKTVLRQVTKVVGDSPALPSFEKPWDEDEVGQDGKKKRLNWKRFPALNRGSHTPELKLNLSEDKIEDLKIIPTVEISKQPEGYYDMSAEKHGVCLIINNENFEGHSKREGTERDEYNLIQTWQYLGYHVEVRKELTFYDIQDIFCDIDGFLDNIMARTKQELKNDSFVCCILSHGDKSVIYGTDDKAVTIEYMECSLGASEKLRDCPKLFFIQACQGGRLGTLPVNTKLYRKDINIKSDGDEEPIQTSRRADIFISYASAPGGKAFRNTKTGSWYISTLCRALCEKGKTHSVDQIQRIINREVAQQYEYVTDSGVSYKQQPSASDQLNRNVHFFYDSKLYKH